MLWVVSNLSLIAAVPLYASWLRRALSQPALPPAASDGGDVPTVAIFGIALIIACTIPLVNVGLYFLLRKYPGSTRLLPPLAPRTAIEIFYLLGLGILAFGVMDTLWAGDWEISLVLGVWFILLIYFRAVSHGKRAVVQRQHLTVDVDAVTSQVGCGREQPATGSPDPHP
jgi:hypothetical protein